MNPQVVIEESGNAHSLTPQLPASFVALIQSSSNRKASIGGRSPLGNSVSSVWRAKFARLTMRRNSSALSEVRLRLWIEAFALIFINMPRTVVKDAIDITFHGQSGSSLAGLYRAQIPST
jgi:hypothetical protein